MTEGTRASRIAYAWLALALTLSKAVQLSIDAIPLFFFDSGGILQNASGNAFIAYRSWLYGWIVRVIALPVHSLTALVVVQVAIGAISAWLLGYLLHRFFEVRLGIAAAAALLFAWDPGQLIYERMVMTENVTLLALILMIWMYVRYLEMPSGWAGRRSLVLASAFGILVVGLRIAYLPSVIALAVLVPFLPVAGKVGLDWRRIEWRSLAMALTVSLVSTGVFHGGYRMLTGYLAGREPAYHYDTGFFLLGAAAPLVEPTDADRSDIAALVERQRNDALFPLDRVYLRSDQLWMEGGLVRRIRDRISDPREANRAAGVLARHAILRRPWGFLRMGIHVYAEYWRHALESGSLAHEHGEAPEPQLPPQDRALVRRLFDLDLDLHHTEVTLARQYHTATPAWNVFLLLTPFLCGWGVVAARGPARLGMVFLLILSVTIFASITLGGLGAVYRYLHPFSFVELMAVAVVGDRFLTRS